MVFAGHSTAGDVDYHSIAGTVDVAGSGCAKGTDHDSCVYLGMNGCDTVSR